MKERAGKVLGRGLSNLLDESYLNKLPSGTMIEELPSEKIIPNPENPRKNFEQTSIQELAQTIEKHGLLQPILVQKKDDFYVVISGERRLRALKSLGYKTIPCVVKALDRKQTLEVALIENIQREELDAIEEAQVYKTLLGDYELTQEELSERVGKNRATIANRVRLLQLPDMIQTAIADGRLSEGQVRPLVAIKDSGQQLKFFQEIIAKSLNSRQVEELVKNSTAEKIKASGKKSTKTDANIKALAEKLEATLGIRVKIKYNPQKQSGNLSLDYFSLDDLEKILKLLGIKKTGL